MGEQYNYKNSTIDKKIFKKLTKKMKISIFFILTIYIQNAMAEGPKTPTSLWDLAITKSHHTAPEPKSERPKFPGNFLSVPPPPISYSEGHDDTLAKPTIILDDASKKRTVISEEGCPKRQSLLKWNEENKSIQFSLEKFYSAKNFFCFVDHVFQTILRDVLPWILFGWIGTTSAELLYEYVVRGFFYGLALVLF